jgi:transcription elongation factor SPT5
MFSRHLMNRRNSGNLDDMNEDVESLSSLFSNRTKNHFMKGDAVIVIKGDLKDLKGSIEKVEDGTVHIQPKQYGLPVLLPN